MAVDLLQKVNYDFVIAAGDFAVWHSTNT